MSELESVIRLALPTDEHTIIALTEAAYAHYVPLIGRKPQPMTTDYAPMIAEGGVWLLEINHGAAGLLVLNDKDDHLLIYSIAIQPDFQKRGLGRKLLAWAEQQASEKGYAVIRLYTNALMTSNIALYKRIGYMETERESFGETTIVHMEKAL